MSDEHVDAVTEAQAQRVADIGVKSEIQDPMGEQHSAPPAASPAPAPASDMIPKARLDKEIAKRKEAESRAQYWDAAIQDQDVFELLQRKYSGAGSPPSPAQTPPQSQWEDDNLEGALDPRVMKELEDVKKQVAQIAAPLMQANAEQQRALLQQKFPDYDKSTDDAQIRTVMAAGRAANLVDAYTLIRAERGDLPSSKKKSKEVQAAATVHTAAVQVRSDLSEADAAYNAAKERHARSGGTDSQALDLMIKINHDRDKMRRFLKSQGG